MLGVDFLRLDEHVSQVSSIRHHRRCPRNCSWHCSSRCKLGWTARCLSHTTKQQFSRFWWVQRRDCSQWKAENVVPTTATLSFPPCQFHKPTARALQVGVREIFCALRALDTTRWSEMFQNEHASPKDRARRSADVGTLERLGKPTLFMTRSESEGPKGLDEHVNLDERLRTTVGV